MSPYYKSHHLHPPLPSLHLLPLHLYSPLLLYFLYYSYHMCLNYTSQHYNLIISLTLMPKIPYSLSLSSFITSHNLYILLNFLFLLLKILYLLLSLSSSQSLYSPPYPLNIAGLHFNPAT